MDKSVQKKREKKREKKRQKKRCICFLAAALIVLCLGRTAQAQEMDKGGGPQTLGAGGERGVPAEAVAGGVCGEDLRWGLYDGALIVRGRGAVRDYHDGRPPWDRYHRQIKEVVLGEGVTGVGAYAFASCSEMEKIVFPSTLSVIDRHAFSGCYFAAPNMLDKLRVLMYDLTQRNEFYYFWEGSYDENEKNIICHAGGSYDHVSDGRLWFRIFRHRFQFRYRRCQRGEQRRGCL